MKNKKSYINAALFIQLFYIICLSKVANLSQISKITLTIKGTGNQYILSDTPEKNTLIIFQIIYMLMVFLKKKKVKLYII